MPALNPVHAKVGKRLHAEPIDQLCAQGLVHHVGERPRPEGRFVTSIPDMESPDRMDALVHALTEFADPAAVFTGSGSYDDQHLAGRAAYAAQGKNSKGQQCPESLTHTRAKPGKPSSMPRTDRKSSYSRAQSRVRFLHKEGIAWLRGL